MYLSDTWTRVLQSRGRRKRYKQYLLLYQGHMKGNMTEYPKAAWVSKSMFCYAIQQFDSYFKFWFMTAD